MKRRILTIAVVLIALAALAWVLFLRGGPPADVEEATDRIAAVVVDAPAPEGSELLGAKSTDTRAVSIGAGDERFTYNTVFTRESWTNAKGDGVQRTSQSYEWASDADEKKAREQRAEQLGGKKIQGGELPAGVVPVGPLDDAERVVLVCRVSAGAVGGLLSQLARAGDFPDSPDDLWDEVEDAAEAYGDDDDTVIWNSWGTITADLKAGQTVLSGEQRATAIRALGFAEGVSVIDAEEDPAGRPAVGLRLSLGGNSQDVWFDSETGWIAQTVFSGNSDVTAAASAPSGTAPQQSSEYVLTESSIVDKMPGDLEPAKAGVVRGSLRCAS